MLLSTNINRSIPESIVDQYAMPFHLSPDGCDQEDPASLAGRAKVTLGDVIAFVETDLSVSPAQRRDRLCALRCLAKALNRSPHLIPAAPAKLREILDDVLPAAHGFKRGRWTNIRSRVTAAVAQTGIPVIPGRWTNTLTPAWALLIDSVEIKAGRLGLSRLSHYCSDRGIAPEQVDRALFDRFLVELEAQSMSGSPQNQHKVAIEQWDIAVATVPGWPQVLIGKPKTDRTYSLDWSDFPASFVADLEAFLRRSSANGPFAEHYVRPQRESTIDLQRKQLRQMASLLVLAGTPVDKVTSLAVLAALPNAKTILEAAHARTGDGSQQLLAFAILLKIIAQHWVHAAPDDVARLSTYAKRLTPERRGMTEKNRERLHQFDHVDNLHALLDLPRAVFAELGKRQKVTRKDALRAQYAMIVELLTVAPMRFANVAWLDLDRHVITTGRGARQVTHLVIPAHEVKNSEPLEVVLPADTVAMLAVYRTRYLPLICATPTPLLFPSDKGRRRNTGTFSTGMKTFIARETGLVMNAHLFRHLGVTLYLTRHPDDLETARRILGHKSIVTTMRFYAEIKTAACFARYDKMIEGLRSEPEKPKAGKTAGTKRGGR